jgi:hypothetical protein
MKSPKEVTKQQELRYFLLVLLDRRIRIREAQKHVDPVDPEPDSEHWLKDDFLQNCKCVSSVEVLAMFW